MGRADEKATNARHVLAEIFSEYPTGSHRAGRNVPRR
jgi:hypothetical protein